MSIFPQDLYSQSCLTSCPVHYCVNAGDGQSKQCFPMGTTNVDSAFRCGCSAALGRQAGGASLRSDYRRSQPTVETIQAYQAFSEPSTLADSLHMPVVNAYAASRRDNSREGGEGIFNVSCQSRMKVGAQKFSRCFERQI